MCVCFGVDNDKDQCFVWLLKSFFFLLLLLLNCCSSGHSANNKSGSGGNVKLFLKIFQVNLVVAERQK